MPKLLDRDLAVSPRIGKLYCSWHGTDICSEGASFGPSHFHVQRGTGHVFCCQATGYGVPDLAEDIPSRYHYEFVSDHEEYERKRKAGEIDRYWDCPCTAPGFDLSQPCPCTPGVSREAR